MVTTLREMGKCILGENSPMKGGGGVMIILVVVVAQMGCGIARAC